MYDDLNQDYCICLFNKKLEKQLEVLCRLKSILSFRTKFCLFHSFFMSHFHYCPSEGG